MRLRHGGILEEWEPRSAGRKRRLLVFFAVAAAMAVGFVLGHWSSDRQLQQVAGEAAEEARRDLAAAVCAEAFMKQPDRETCFERALRLGEASTRVQKATPVSAR